MKVNRCRHLFSIGGQLLTFIRKFCEGKNSNFGRKVFLFVLPIQNKSPFSGKIITSFKIERMSLHLLAIWPKHKIEMQIIYGDKKLQVKEFVFQGLNMEKWRTGKQCDGVAVIKKRENRYVSKRWHPSFNKASMEEYLFTLLNTDVMDLLAQDCRVYFSALASTYLYCRG